MAKGKLVGDIIKRIKHLIAKGKRPEAKKLYMKNKRDINKAIQDNPGKYIPDEKHKYLRPYQYGKQQKAITDKSPRARMRKQIAARRKGQRGSAGKDNAIATALATGAGAGIVGGAVMVLKKDKKVKNPKWKRFKK